MVHSYDLTYKCCSSCFACKMIDGPSSGRCAMQDDLRPLLVKIETEVDVSILGSPIYFGQMTGEMRSFIERLFFAPLDLQSAALLGLPSPDQKTAALYTMNVGEETAKQMGYEAMFNSTEVWLSRIFGVEAETFCCFDTCQFADYSKVIMEYMDPAHKAARRAEVFPQDCERAFELGERLASTK